MSCIQQGGTFRNSYSNIINCYFDICHCVHLPLLSAYSTECAVLHAGTALDALSRINNVWLLDSARDSADRAVAGTLCAALALLRIDYVVEQCLADACRTSLVDDVCFILISEVLDC